MSLFKEWNDLFESQDDKSFRKFWEEYCDAEIKLYTEILKSPETKMEGKLGETAEKFGIRPVIFMGFLDGIQTSLKNPFDLKQMTEDSEFSLDIDFRELFKNMHKADAEHLYTIAEWNNVYSDEELQEIYDEFRRSRTVVKEKKPGRNDPCPCGSGKKYKNCCGKN